MNQLIPGVLAVLGIPLFAVMAISAIASHRAEEIDLQAILISFYQLTEMPLLRSLPLFAFGGYVLARSGAPRRLVRFSSALVGWLPGGVAIVAIWASALLTAITGASGITIVALGGILLPALLDQGYRERFSLGLITSSGSLGILFPPSLPVILYGVITGVSIHDLFLAGALPGLLLLTLLSGYSMIQGRTTVERPRFSTRELKQALMGAIWEAPLPAVITIGIFQGTFTVSEASVIALLYILVVEVVIYRDVGLRELPGIARECMVLVGGILIILGMTMAVTNVVIDAQVPERLFDWISPYMTSKISFLIALNLFLLLVGCMLDVFAATVLIVPLLVPLAVRYQVDPLHLGVIFLTNLGIGYATPPVGMNLFIASVRFRKPILTLYWAALPFIAIMLVALAVVTFVPGLSLWLPRWLGSSG